MSAWRTPAQGPPPSRTALEETLGSQGLAPRLWSNESNYRYGYHEHHYHKVLYCVSGSIVFHTAVGDFALAPGDRLDVEAGTSHAATVGPEGVTCVEAGS